MAKILHIISGDVAGEALRASGIDGDILVWRDILYDGRRGAGKPDAAARRQRADFLEAVTGGGLSRSDILETLGAQYDTLERAVEYDMIVLWFDACLFDQSMLCHILACMPRRAIDRVELLSVGTFPGVEPFDGLGQLLPEQLLSLYGGRRRVTAEQFDFAGRVEDAFAAQDLAALRRLSSLPAAPLPHVPAAAERWLLEQPDRHDGLGLLEKLILQAVRAGAATPADIMASVAARDRHPRYWGDITLWAKINGLASRRPPLLRLRGPTPLLPQWHAGRLDEYTVTPLEP